MRRDRKGGRKHSLPSSIDHPISERTRLAAPAKGLALVTKCLVERNRLGERNVDGAVPPAQQATRLQQAAQRLRLLLRSTQLSLVGVLLDDAIDRHLARGLPPLPQSRRQQVV